MTTIYVTDDSYGTSCKGGWVTVADFEPQSPEPEPYSEPDVES